MGVIIPQVVTEDRASGGQVIDGSLKFNPDNYNNLTRTPGSAGNRRTWTYSVWVKLANFEDYNCILAAGDYNYGTYIWFRDKHFAIGRYSGGYTFLVEAAAFYRDPSAWYHVVVRVDSTQVTAADRVKLYINNEQITSFTTETYPSQDFDTDVNDTSVHYIGKRRDDNLWFRGYMSQVYLVDGQALDPSYFGFTDPLTGTWRPKKYTGTFGTNGFYLPMDGNSPIGQDVSGNGNNWTPVNFGGSNTIEKATGALPILNTTNGGRVVTVGVRTDTAPGNGPVGVSTHLILALPLVGSTADVSNQINSARTALTFTAQGNAAPTTTQSNFYGGSYTFDGTTDRVFTNVPNGDALYLQNSNFTVECWVRLASGQTNDRYMLAIANGTASNANGSWQMRINGSKFNPGFTSGTTQYNLTSTQNYVPDKWTHVAFVREGNQQRLYIDGVLDVTTSYTQTPNNLTSGQFSIGGAYNNIGGTINGQIQDIRIYDNVAKYTSNFIPASTDPDILPDTPSGVAGGSTLTKITDGAVSFDGSGDYLSIADSADFELGSGDFTIEFYVNSTQAHAASYISAVSKWQSSNFSWMVRYSSADIGTGWSFFWSTTGSNYSTVFGQAINDGEWHHIAVTRSGTTIRTFTDGVQNNTTTTSDTFYNGTADVVVGSDQGGNYFNGFISNLRCIKGTALYTSNFTPPAAPLTNVTNTKLLCCQSTTSATDATVSPTSITANGNATATNFNPFTTDINAVRGQESGWNTLNPLQLVSAAGGLSDGNLKSRVTPPSTGFCGSTGTLAVSSGKWYYEVLVTAASGMHGWVGSDWTKGDNGGLWYNSARGYGIYGLGGNKFNNGTNSAYGSSFANGDIISCALDLDNGFIMWAENGVWYNGGNPLTGANAAYTGLTGEFVTANFAQAANTGNDTPAYYNFGQKPFKYAPPEGFKTLCLANLPRPTKAAVRPDKYFNTVLWTGNQTARTISMNSTFTPDFIWIKNRTSGYNHSLQDSVRGFGPSTKLNSNTSTQENSANTEPQAGYIDSVAAGSFNINASATATWYHNNVNSNNYIAWCWKAGGAAVSNTDGSITSSVSANQDAGFSIVTYAGQSSNFTWGHGLGKAPSMVFITGRNNTSGWSVYHKAMGPTYRSQLNQIGKQELMSYFQNTSPTDTVFSVTTNGGTGASGVNYIAYCWSEIEGFSKAGKWTGNGNADGPYVHCGFRPAFIILKNYAGGSETDWIIQDSTRSTYNPVDGIFRANTSQEEATGSSNYYVDFLSNGFKLRTSSAAWNELNSLYLFMAFAEAPTNNLFGGQANAR